MRGSGTRSARRSNSPSGVIDHKRKNPRWLTAGAKHDWTDGFTGPSFDQGPAIVITGDVHVSQSAGLFSSPSALSTETVTRYWPLGTVYH